MSLTYRYYIIGGRYKNYNFEAFDAAEANLEKRANVEVINPTKNLREWIAANGNRKPNDLEYDELRERDLCAMKDCHCVYLLKDWEICGDACDELKCAIENGLEIELEL